MSSLPLSVDDLPSASARRFATTTRIVTATGAIAALALLAAAEPVAAALVLAVMFGWSEVDGACGTSHVCAITPLRALTAEPHLWLNSVVAYTIGGLASSAAVGALVAGLGLAVKAHARMFAAAIAVLAIVLCARELGIVRFRMPEVRRQTHKMWALEFGFVTGAAMWGIHIGLAFATVIRHGGFYVIVLLAMLSTPGQGASLFVCYWIGRSLPMWFAPLLTNEAWSASSLYAMVHTDTRAYEQLAAAGLLITTVLAYVLARG